MVKHATIKDFTMFVRFARNFDLFSLCRCESESHWKRGPRYPQSNKDVVAVNEPMKHSKPWKRGIRNQQSNGDHRAAKFFPNVKIVGHSFIRRFADDLRNSSGSFVNTLGLSDYVGSLGCFGRGGAMVDDILQSFDIGNANIIILDVGTNDLCNDITGYLLAKKVFNHAVKLLACKSVKHVKILEILKRAKTRNLGRDYFEQQRQSYNNTMKKLSETHSYISFATQPGFENLNEWSNDGIHATTYYGKNAYKSNIKNFIIDACAKV